MFKKIVSYLIIFSILYADMGHCGSVGGRETPSPDRDDTSKIRIRQPLEPEVQSEQRPEKTPLMVAVGKRNNDPAVPNLPKNFSFESFTETSQAQSLALYNRGESPEDYTDEMGGSVNATFEAINGKRQGQTLSEWKRSGGNGNINHSGNDVIPVDDPLIQLEDESEEEPEPTVQWRKEPAPNPRLSYDSESVQGMQLFFEDLWTEDGDRSLPSSRSLVINREDSDRGSLTSAQELKDFVIISSDLSKLSVEELSNLSPESRAFLRYIKKNIIDNEINWKQKAGIVVGIATGAGVAWPLMLIFYDPIFDFYFTHASSLAIDPKFNVDFEYFSTLMQDFRESVNFYKMLGIVGFPLGVDAASRTAMILFDLAKENTQPFSFQKTKEHKAWLIFSKLGIYSGVFFATALPAYYLYASLTECHSETHANNFNNKEYKFLASYDIFFNNISYAYFNNTKYNCTSLWGYSLPLENIKMLAVGIPFLVFDTLLQYGHQLSYRAEQWITAHFSRKTRAGLPASPIELKYLNQFKDLKRMIYALDEDALGELYNIILVNGLEKEKAIQCTGVNHDNLAFTESLHALRVLKTFHEKNVVHLEPQEPEYFKKTCSSYLGWGISLIATAGRGLAFGYAISKMLSALSDVFFGERENSNNQQVSIIIGLSFILGGGIANIMQGCIEKEAVQEGVYDILRGKKIADGTSHRFLRLGIKIWDAIYGTLNTLPYIVLGMEALMTDWFTDNYDYTYRFTFMAWATISLISSFGIADAFTNTIAFHHSNLGLVNAYDRIRAYWSPTPEYERDKLIRIVRQIRKLYKALNGNVLEEVDWLLNQDQGNPQRDRSETEEI